MSLRLYDSAARQVRDFTPLVEGQVGIYVCGPTPQAAPHIGHLRGAVAFDVLRRWLTRTGYQVTFVRNVTDIDDKILVKSAEAGTPWWAHAYRYEREFGAAYAAVNVLPPTYEPRATGHMIEMIELMQRLVDAGHAYPAPDGCGDVYFDVRSFAEYGALTRQRLADLGAEEGGEAGGVAAARKRDPRDFTLWKGSKPTDPPTASWPTPWGRGRPGWHLECSAMATRYLGGEFDIHGGGLDLRFPHHENEQAQSRAAGDGFARYWLHNAWVVAAGEKMSKSLGNTLALSVLLQHARPAVIRYLLTAPHYRSNIEVGDDSLAEAQSAYERIEGFVLRAGERFADVAAALPAELGLPSGFTAAMDDDLGTPAALAVLHDAVRAGNRALEGGAAEEARQRALEVRAMADVLGVDPLDGCWRGAGQAAAAGGAGGVAEDPVHRALDSMVRATLDAREAARKERDFARADALRDQLTAAGIAVEDTPAGPRWSVER